MGVPESRPFERRKRLQPRAQRSRVQRERIRLLTHLGDGDRVVGDPIRERLGFENQKARLLRGTGSSVFVNCVSSPVDW